VNRKWSCGRYFCRLLQDRVRCLKGAFTLHRHLSAIHEC
jgi:hypothetical protein